MPDPTFVTDGDWGTGTGVAHTANEADQIIYDLSQRIVVFEDDPPIPNQITSVVQSGDQITFYLEDSTALGPVSLPIATFRDRGEWQPSTVYERLDVVRVTADGIYLVIVAHTSGLTFDPDALDSSFEPEYLLMMSATAVASDSGTIYDFGFELGATAPEADAVLGRKRLGRSISMAANFVGSYGGVESPPDADYEIDVRVDNVSIGTITVHGGGSASFATVGGTAKSATAGQEVTFVAPDEGSAQDPFISLGSFVIAARVV